MRFRLKRTLIFLGFLASIPLVMHVMEILRFKARSLHHEKQLLRLDPLPMTGTCDPGKCNPTVDGMVNVHIVPHSHTDVGWKKTMMQYFNGQTGDATLGESYGYECTMCILDNAVRELLLHPSRRFIFVEMAFFSLWFDEQTENMKIDVRKLVAERRLEFMIGGWCMSDSATTYYDDIIDQHTHGFQWIEREFGECAMPKSAWHVDQFGHSREHSSLFAQMGFDGIFLGRIDFQDQDRRNKTRNMETIWRTSPHNLGDKASLFTSVLYDGYFSPEFFRWEGWGPGMLSDRNSEQYVSEFLKIVKERSSAYKSNNLLIPFGGDFAFKTAAGWYDGIDKLINYVNIKQASGIKVNVLYSTPTCYINAVNKENRAFETMKTDFFPYSTIPNTFWTGFYTSRPGLKRHIKDASSLLQTCKIVSTLARINDIEASISKLKEAVAILQHHDGITGTEKQHVTDDYNLMLSEGETECQTVIDTAYRRLFSRTEDALSQEFCPKLNISVCPVSEKYESFVVSLFNPLGTSVTHFVRLPIPGGDYTVWGEGKDIEAETIPIPESTFAIPERGHSKANSELVFRVELPPLGYSSYGVKRLEDDSEAVLPPLQENGHGDIVIENEFLSLTIDGKTGKTRTLTNLENKQQIDFEQSFLYYVASPGESRDPADKTGGFLGSHKRSSGAYAFVPDLDIGAVNMNGPRAEGIKVKTFKGINSIEVHQEFGPWLHQVIRLYDGAPYLEFEWTVGPLTGTQTTEVITRFETNLKTHGLMYTDSNGREMIPRKLNYRETWNLTVTSPISGNFYPVTGRAMLQDTFEKLQLTVLTDRCQGGASLADGRLELMVHRRTSKDDDLGVEEPLSERGIDGHGLIIRGKHYIFLNSMHKAAEVYRPFGLQVHHPPTMSLVPSDSPTFNGLVKMWSGLTRGLPDHVHLLTLDMIPEKSDVFLLRLENYFETSDNRDEQHYARLELEDLFSSFNVIAVRELSLGGNHDILSVKRLRWKTTYGTLTPEEIGSEEAKYMHEPPFPITLQPMEIRTFQIQVNFKYFNSNS